MLLLSVLSGCVGSVSAPFIPGGFGAVESATWLELRTGSGSQQLIMVSNVPEACAKHQDLYTALYDLADAGFQASGIDPALTCADIEDPYLAWVDANAALYYDGAHYVDGLSRSDYEAREYEAGADVTAFGNSVYSELPAMYIPDNLASEGCFGSVIDAEEGNERWQVEDGTWTITSVEPGSSMSGSMEGTVSDDGDVAFSMSFDVDYCLVDVG